MAKKRIAKKAAPAKRPARKNAVKKPKVAPNSASVTVRRVREAEQWPTQQQLAEIAIACGQFVRYLKDTVLPTMPKKTSHRKTPLVNYYAISESLSGQRLLALIDRVEVAFYTRRPEFDKYVRQFPKVSRVFHGFPIGWHHSVAVPAQHLWNTIAALLLFCRRDVLSLTSWTKTAEGWKRDDENLAESPDETNFGEWLDEAVKLCQQLRQVVGLQAPLNSTRARKLQKAFDYIKANQPKVGKAVAEHIGVKPPTFRRHYVEPLKHLGIRNEPERGYVFP